MKVLAIETSCDDTSCAIVDDKGCILSNVINSQIDVHGKFNGVVPELASRHHLENINFIIDQALQESSCSFKDLDAIAVTNTPGLVGSLLVGLMTAKTLAYTYSLPLVPVNHLYAHIWANFLEHKGEKCEPTFPCIALLVSGGHSDLYLLKNYDDISILGRTRDDAVGEAFDKVAKLLNLGYPGGPAIDRISKETEERIELPKPYMPHTYDFSFSGLKTAVLNKTKHYKGKISQKDKNIIAASFQDSAVKVLVRKTIKAAVENNAEAILLCGGVAANSLLRANMRKEAEKRNIEINYPPIILCTDNAAMVGARAIHEIKKHGLNHYKNKIVKDPFYYSAKSNTE